MNHKQNKTMTHTHTPGPWELEHCRNGDGSKFITINGQGPSGAWLADIQAGNVNGNPANVTETHLANARLISSAPDLLAALEGLLSDNYLADPINADRMAEARAAVAKATGRGDG